MEKATVYQGYIDFFMYQKDLSALQRSIKSVMVHENKNQRANEENIKEMAEVLFLTSYPPRVCGIATYSSDLISSVKNKFSSSLAIKVCALQSAGSDYIYPEEVKYVLNTSQAEEYKKLAATINEDDAVKLVLVQHEFGFFRKQEEAFEQFLSDLYKPVVIAFHTVLPYPNELLKQKVIRIAEACKAIIVMTKSSAEILTGSYGIPQQKFH
jgi:hypothetical protein